MQLFIISNLKSARTYEWRQVVLSRKPVHSGISKFIMQFPYSFHILCIILSTVYYHTVLFGLPFLFLWSHLKVDPVPSSDWSLFCKRSTIVQLNVQVAIAENEEQSTLSNILYIAFQNCYSLSLKFSLEEVFLKCRQSDWKILVVEFIFHKASYWGPATLSKNAF